MPLDRHTFPKGGWIYRQPQTNWANPMPMGFTFDQTVDAILKHRRMNPAITTKHQLSLDWNVVAQELEQFTMKRLGMVETLPKSVASAGLVNRAGAVVAAGRRMAIGASNLLAWSDNGKVVAKEVAEARAGVCVGCSLNSKGDWKSIFTEPAAEMIKRQLEAKNVMSLATSKDGELRTCEACWCPLQLKVWAPLEYALRKMSDDTKAKLPEHCWMKTENDPTA